MSDSEMGATGDSGDAPSIDLMKWHNQPNWVGNVRPALPSKNTAASNNIASSTEAFTSANSSAVNTVQEIPPFAHAPGKLGQQKRVDIPPKVTSTAQPSQETPAVPAPTGLPRSTPLPRLAPIQPAPPTITLQELAPVVSGTPQDLLGVRDARVVTSAFSAGFEHGLTNAVERVFSFLVEVAEAQSTINPTSLKEVLCLSDGDAADASKSSEVPGRWASAVKSCLRDRGDEFVRSNQIPLIHLKQVVTNNPDLFGAGLLQRVQHINSNDTAPAPAPPRPPYLRPLPLKLSLRPWCQPLLFHHPNLHPPPASRECQRTPAEEPVAKPKGRKTAAAPRRKRAADTTAEPSRGKGSRGGKRARTGGRAAKTAAGKGKGKGGASARGGGSANAAATETVDEVPEPAPAPIASSPIVDPSVPASSLDDSLLNSGMPQFTQVPPYPNSGQDQQVEQAGGSINDWLSNSSTQAPPGLPLGQDPSVIAQGPHGMNAADMQLDANNAPLSFRWRRLSSREEPRLSRKRLKSLTECQAPSPDPQS
ncbi:unnamed protein product [Parascedosporium putredinis]|uniref:Uncharacterized protein n=1 Tax=Parascedosporium putredinis TaxID=1442378 RepID=A0A9P1GXC9_9PEZI|nr:unnamed protein product [Parascedosporium putredinis]CAI7989072.1 unnamed protein product [Parascedosporium putredinis]